MKFSSISAAKLLLILSIAIGAGSAWKGLEWQKSAESLTRQLQTARLAEQQAQQRTAMLAEHLPGGEEPLSLEDTLIDLLNTLHSRQLGQRVQMNSVSAPGATGAGVRELYDLAEPVAGSSLYTLTIEVRGTYREYAGLRRYIAQALAHPVAMTRLAISGRTFEMRIQLVGAI